MQVHSWGGLSRGGSAGRCCASSPEYACRCNDRGLGPGLEAGPSLDKRSSPRGLELSVSQSVVSWSLLVVCGCWSQNGAALFRFSFVVVLSGASCSISVVVLCVWLESPYKRCFACGSSPVVVVLVWCSKQIVKRKSCVLDWEWKGNAHTITNGAVDKTDEADRIERKSAESSRNGGLERDADVGWREK